MAENFSATTHSVEEMQQWFVANKQNIENFANINNLATTLRDVTQSIDTTRIQTINKDELKTYLKSVGSYEKQLRKTARYLYYRSNLFFRIVNWYADLWDLRCRKITPKYSLTKNNDKNKFLKSFEDTIDLLDTMNLQGNMTEVLINTYIEDVSYNIAFLNDDGMWFYRLNADECVIDTRYNTGDLGFAVDMSYWKSKKRQKVIEYLGEPLKSMYQRYIDTGVKYQHCDDEYAACFKFRTDDLNTVVPPLLSVFLRFASVAELEEIQAIGDALSIYKLVYMPLTTKSNSKNVNDFEISPEVAKKYFKKMLDDGVLPANISAAMVPGDELKVIDFDNGTDKDITSVQSAENEVLNTAGGGAVIGSSNINSNAAFSAWIKAETEFAMSTLLPQINGFANRMAKLKLGTNAAKIEYFEVSVYTKSDLKKELLESAQYSFANRLAYNTLNGMSEKDTLSLMFLENEILKLPEIMKYPLASSFTSSGNETEDGYTSEVGQGRPIVDDPSQLTDEGDRSRNK